MDFDSREKHLNSICNQYLNNQDRIKYLEEEMSINAEAIYQLKCRLFFGRINYYIQTSDDQLFAMELDKEYVELNC